MAKKAGSLEEEYFYKRSRELIEKRIENEKKFKRETSKAQHKNHCATCGENMKSHPTASFSEGIYSCLSCGSIHISATILQSISGAQHEELRKVYFEIEEERKQAKVA